MVRIKISPVISVSIFFRLLPHFFVDPGGPSQRLYSGHWSELGSTKDKGVPHSFSWFSYFLVLFSVLPGFRGCSTGSLCVPEPWRQMVWQKERNPYFLAPLYGRRLWVKDPSLADLAQLRFRHPDYFQAGSLHAHVDFWEDLIFSTGCTCPQVYLLQTIREGVRVDSFFRHFKGNFKGKRYDSAVPPISFFPKSPFCHQLR